jgi:hypothetical protein
MKEVAEDIAQRVCLERSLAQGDGQGAGVQDQHGVGALLGDRATQLGPDGLVVPGAGADEVLHGLAVGAAWAAMGWEVLRCRLLRLPCRTTRASSCGSRR